MNELFTRTKTMFCFEDVYLLPKSSHRDRTFRREAKPTALELDASTARIPGIPPNMQSSARFRSLSSGSIRRIFEYILTRKQQLNNNRLLQHLKSVATILALVEVAKSLSSARAETFKLRALPVDILKHLLPH